MPLFFSAIKPGFEARTTGWQVAEQADFVMLSAAKHLRMALNIKERFFAMLSMTGRRLFFSNLLEHGILQPERRRRCHTPEKIPLFHQIAIIIRVKPRSEPCSLISSISRKRNTVSRNGVLATAAGRVNHKHMLPQSALSQCEIVAFIPIVHAEAAKNFYGETLGLRLVSEELPFALVFDANGIMLRLAIVDQLGSARGTVLGWKVPDIAAVVKTLMQAGIRFERYEAMRQDDLGIWTTPTGAKVAWFKDPDGNILSITEFPLPEG